MAHIDVNFTVSSVPVKRRSFYYRNQITLAQCKLHDLMILPEFTCFIILDDSSFLYFLMPNLRK
jgi:hypothetical protein